MVDLQREARALGDPTRHRLFRHIAAAPEPVGVAELTDLVQLNHNAIRQHLAVLKGAGLILEETEDRHRPGRPRLFYRLDPEIAGRWGTAGPYAWLAGMLSEALQTGQDPRQIGRTEGIREAVAVSGAGDPTDLLEEEMVRRGFRPTRVDKGNRLDFVVGRCPFVDVAAGNPDTVCQLHLGLAEGLTEGLGGVEVERLVIHDAHQAGCRLSVQPVSLLKTPA
ncbi:MAG TPA: helix-turn-helix domain-containing protein [Acidimicrobiales bacterium]|jgi:predicted ArsR family transcriptional regulator